MPHSGGGGSHGGGSHHSSHRSSGGSHRSSSGGSSGPKISKKPFKGSHTYVIYDKVGNSRLLYSSSANYNARFSKAEFWSQLIFSLFFVVPGIIALIIAIVLSFKSISFGMNKTTHPYYVDDAITIFDEYDMISDDEERNLAKALENFRDETGIIPSVEFIHEEQWRDNYSDMEKFAYNEYVEKFYDEYHLLVVYSDGYHDENTGFNEFYYHTMWGDDLSKTADSRDEDKFLDILSKELTKANGENIGAAIQNTFGKFLIKLKDKGFSFNSGFLFSAIFLVLWGGAFAGCGLFLLVPTLNSRNLLQKEGEKMFKVDDVMKKAECAYCGCSYYLNTVGNCPSCNAPLPANPENTNN